MEDAHPLAEARTSGADAVMTEAGPLPPGFVRRNPNVINLDKDNEYDSDDTLLGDEDVERVVPPVSKAHREQRQAKVQAAIFRQLETYTLNGRTVQLGRTFQDENGNFLRVISIKQHRGTGDVEVESFRDDHKSLQTHSYDGRTLKPGKTVEMADGEFLRIKGILEDRRTGEIRLRGFRFKRNKSMNRQLELKFNEVTMVTRYNPDDARDITEQSIETVELAAVVKIRELVKTNQQFPALSYREIDPESSRLGKKYISDHCRLVCRWKYLEINKKDGSLTALTDVESDEGCSIPQAELRTNFRGRTIKGGTSPGWLDEEVAFERVEQMRSRGIDPLGFHRLNPAIIETTNRKHQRRYTLTDAYCGGGGISRGAQDAGLRVECAFDHDKDAVATYRLNFPHTKCECVSAYDFAMSINGNYKADVLHLSPPCQRFSPYHNRPFPNDEQYEATFLATETLIKKTTPRIVTLEETFGLTRNVDNLEWFNAMIQMFTKLGFSVRWKVFNLLDFGLPQPRKRLFIFASCPGETLPDFPEPTHCSPQDLRLNPTLSPFSTVEDAIGKIPRDFPDHAAQLRTRFNRDPYPGNLPLRNTICCSGSLSHHPSGKRCFTTRELACLQGFPLEHRFGRRGARKQIGNAVPPVAARVFFEKVLEALRRADGM